MRVRWTTDAADDLERICDYIAETSPDSAHRIARLIVDGIASLHTFPNRGRRAAIRSRDHARRIRADHPTEHRTSRPPLLRASVWVVREDALAVAARAGSGRRRSAGAVRRGVQGLVVWHPRLVASGRPSGGFGPRADRTQRGRSRPEDCWIFIRPRPRPGKYHAGSRRSVESSCDGSADTAPVQADGIVERGLRARTSTHVE